jgi:type I restriction enzyme R subunit
MRQAIEEGFILDVLQHYMTYKAYYALEKTIQDDPEMKTRRAQRKVARFTASSPAESYQSGYIRVETAAADYPEIQKAVAHVVDACRLP